VFGNVTRAAVRLRWLNHPAGLRVGVGIGHALFDGVFTVRLQMSIEQAVMRLSRLALVTVGCAVIAGCGNEERKARPEPANFAHSVRAQTPVPSARFFERTVYGDGPNGFTETVRGAFDWSARTGWVVVAKPGRMELIQIGARCYRHWPPEAWREFTANDPGGLCNSALLENPATAFEFYNSLGGLNRVGTSRVNGVATTHYRMQLNIGAVKGRLELWIDADGVVRRSRQQGESARDFVGVRDYRDFGVQVHVRPPRGKHTKLKELIKGDG
jgi:hypothetical protein